MCVRVHTIPGLGDADAELALEARHELGANGIRRQQHAVGGGDDGRDAALVGKESGTGLGRVQAAQAARSTGHVGEVE